MYCDDFILSNFLYNALTFVIIDSFFDTLSS